MTMRTDSHGQQVSLLGYGMMRLPVEGGGSARENPNAPIDQEIVNEMVDYAISHGVNYFDTSPVYCRGESETVTGKALSRHPRTDYLIATKMSNFKTFTYDASVNMYHQSMRNLQVDYFDYYLLHNVGTPNGFKNRFVDNGMLDFLINERAEGRIRNLGFSFHGVQEEYDLLMQLHDKVHWDFVQIQMNYVDWHFAHEINPNNVNADYLYGELEQRNIPAIIMEPLLGGRLASLNPHTTELLKTQSPQSSLASWAFRYCGSKPLVLTSLSGMTYMEHLQDNIHTHSPLKPLTDAELSLLERVADEIAHYPSVPCTACQYCMPCPFGIDIPSVFAHYNKSINEGNVVSEGSVEQREFRRARKAYLQSYDKSVSRMRQADHCIACGECKLHCPQNIDIPQKMQIIEKYTNHLKDSLL